MNIRRIKKKQSVVPPQILPSKKEPSCIDDELSISAIQQPQNPINKKPLRPIAETSLQKLIAEAHYSSSS